MPIMIAAITVVGAVCLLDLLLTFAVIRRLREHTDMLAVARGSARRPAGLSAGEPPGTFAAVTTDGDLVHDTSGLRVIAFFATWCSMCPEQVGPFVGYLRTHAISRDSVLVVSVGPDDELPSHLAPLAGLARICLERDDGQIATAFKVPGFPMFYLLDADGTVVVNDHDPAALSEPAVV